MKALVILGLMQLSLTWGLAFLLCPWAGWHPIWEPHSGGLCFPYNPALKVMVNKFDIKKRKTKNTPLKDDLSSEVPISS